MGGGSILFVCFFFYLFGCVPLCGFVLFCFCFCLFAVVLFFCCCFFFGGGAGGGGGVV